MHFLIYKLGVLDPSNRELPSNQQLLAWCGGCKCWAPKSSGGPGAVSADCIDIGCEVLRLHNQFNQDFKGFQKGQTLLDYLHTLAFAPTGTKTTKQLVFRTTTGRVVCQTCWAVAAGFTVKESNGAASHVLNPQFKKMMSKVRQGMTDASSRKKVKVPTKHKSVAVLAFLHRYMEHATDRVPSMDSDDETDGHETVNRQRVHLDAARKSEVYTEFEKHLTKVQEIDSNVPSKVSLSYFLKILRENYRVIQHKHSNFSQCYLCFLFRELKARATTEQDKKFIQEHREAHYRIVYLERVEYHMIRVLAALELGSYFSIIIDAMSKYKTSNPTLTE
jgi:mRNA-degrading endonuclease RelE of RelBE toxin-antitoxin system